MHHAVIMAGGSGTRLWPLSRASRPKQLLKLFEGRSLLRRSFDRLRALLDAKQIYIITGEKYIPAMAEQLPEMPHENFLAEPCARDTANAVGLAAFLLARKDPDGVMGIFTADHIIEPVDLFAQTVHRGYETAKRHADALVTFGVTPTSAHTGFGYVHRGDLVSDGVREVRAFKEKPDAATAKRYLESGDYEWNSGMFVWRIPTIIEQIQKHQPATAAGLAEVAAVFDDPAKKQWRLDRFNTLTRISVDFAILEKADRVLTVELPCKWLDVGSWTALADVFPADDAGNVSAGGVVQTLDAKGNIFVSESSHLFAAIGVEGLVVVHSEDATLICRREDAQRIKEMVEQVKADSGDQFM